MRSWNGRRSNMAESSSGVWRFLGYYRTLVRSDIREPIFCREGSVPLPEGREQQGPPESGAPTGRTLEFHSQAVFFPVASVISMPRILSQEVLWTAVARHRCLSF